MKKSSVILGTLGLLAATLFYNSNVFAGDIEWSGVYRVEGNSINNSEMRSDHKRNLDYGLSHLVLRPKITVSDGFTIYGQFDIFNNAAYPNSQLGQVWGSGVRTTGTSSSEADSNGLSRTQKAEAIEVSQLYLTYNQEFAQLIVGRAPIQFGLGMTYSAGRGLFDHWYDTRDLVGYKIVMGNIYFLPMFGKSSEGNLNQNDDVDNYMIQVQYENPESDIEMGVFYQIRKSGDQGSDAPTGATAIGGTGSDNKTGINTKSVNVYALRDNERFRLGLEASFMSGETGVRTVSSDKVTWNGFGIAAEGEYRPEGSHWKWGLKTGLATGDDPSSDAKYEGFTFNRNYDVAMLLFNHPLGQADFLRTGAMTGSTVRDADGNIQVADVESISNVLYLAPTGKYAFNDRWSLDNTLITGWLETSPIKGKSFSKELGYEWDASVIYSPRKGVQWINQVGLLLPGGTWKADGLYDNKFAYGFATKAAISF